MTAPAASPSSIFAQAATQLTGLGYRLVPLMPREKRPGEFVGGKWQGMGNWPRYKTTPPSQFELNLWCNKWQGANVGIILGTPAGDGLVVIAIDLDLRDQDELREIVSQMPASPMSKAGAKGETIFYRAKPEVKSRAFNRYLDTIKNGKREVERIADLLTGNETKQTVVPPSQHPDGFDKVTNKKVSDAFDYRWLRGPVKALELPVFGEDDMEKFEEALRALGWDSDPSASAPPGIIRAQPSAVKPAAGDSDSVETSIWKALNKAALADLASWVPELGIFNCQKARSGFEGVATWRASSSGRPDADRKRNLSIQPSGIKDFGTNQTYSPLDLIQCANGCTLSEAYEWLRYFVHPVSETGVIINLKIPPRSDGAAKGPGATVHALPVETGGEPGDDPIPPPVRTPESTPAFFGADMGMEEWPEKQCFPEGLVGQIARWICDTAVTPTPILCYGAALALVGTVAGRQFRGPTGTGTHLYTIAVAPTGAGKDHPMRAVTTALSDAGMSGMIGPSDFTADTAVIGHVAAHPLSVCMMDEFGSFWRRISGKKSGNWERAITKALREPWGASFGMMKTKQYVGIPAQDIWWPALSIFGATTPTEFFGALSGTDIENGMVNRLFVLPTGRYVDDKRSREEIKAAYFSETRADLLTPPHIVSALKQVRDWQGEMIGQQFQWPAAQRPNAPTITTQIDEDASEILFTYREWISARTREDEAFGSFYSRAAETAQRVATIHAVGRSAFSKKNPVISRADIEQAIRLVDWSMRQLWLRIYEHQTPEGTKEVVRAVYHAIERRGGREVSRTLMRRGLHGITKRDLNDAIEELEEAGWIAIKVTKETPGQKKPTTVYSIIDKPRWAS